jgi:hypothetical protein
MKYFIFILLFCKIASADEAFINYGVGILESAKSSFSETKMIDVGYRSFIWDGLYWQNKAGVWIDNSGDPNRSSSGYASSGIGLEVDLKPIELRTGSGLAFITSPDHYLGGIFPQFDTDFYAGVRDRFGDGIGIKYDHISSAGIFSYNQGRDFVTFEISYKW